jgi:hypothetical protein
MKHYMLLYEKGLQSADDRLCKAQYPSLSLVRPKCHGGLPPSYEAIYQALDLGASKAVKDFEAYFAQVKK